jgi:hypothetical protein
MTFTVMCDNCHSSVEVSTPLVRCLRCQKALCTDCNTHGLCPKDYQTLAAEIQIRLINIDKQYDRTMRQITLFGTIGTPTLFVLGLFLIFLGPWYGLAAVIGALSVLVVSALLFSRKDRQRDEEKRLMLSRIGQPEIPDLDHFFQKKTPRAVRGAPRTRVAIKSPENLPQL